MIRLPAVNSGWIFPPVAGSFFSGNRSSYMIANLPLTWPQFRIGMLHFFVAVCANVKHFFATWGAKASSHPWLTRINMRLIINILC